MKVTLDVGQYVSAAINPKGHPAQILLAWQRGEFELWTSLPILDDLRRVLFYPHIRKRLSRTDEEIHHFVHALAVAC
jgi:predicted nucleic acid-binding protein